MNKGIHTLLILCLLLGSVSAAEPETDEIQAIRDNLQHLQTQLAAMQEANSMHLADAAVFAKGAEWAMRYTNKFTEKDLTTIKEAISRGEERLESLTAHQTPWTTKKGKVLRGFVSAVDGSIQPYGLIVPNGYDGRKPMRLDVVLHGSSKPVGMSELKFMARFDEGDTNKVGPEVDYIELHPLGRVENCYRWAGETDVFEAIEHVCQNYRIDRDRMVLRGMSMGASGTWHLGLKHPDQFVAIGPYCGYVDTHQFSQTPIPSFIRVGPLPPHQEIGLHMLDSVDYAANASVVPTIAAIGEKDIFFQAHVIMGNAFKKEGLSMVNLISQGTGHVIDPVIHREQLRRIGEHAAEGLNHDPGNLRFVTWTLKYNRCHWLELLGLSQHYKRSEFIANVTDTDHIQITELKNITRFALHRPLSRLTIASQEIKLPSHKENDVLAFSKSAEGWRCDGLRSKMMLTGKRPGLQGPIDDAFASPFLCVRGTGKPWNVEINAWAEASLRRFANDWAKYMRGDLPLKNDTEVTEADLQDKHLILFGDPGSNSWIAKALPDLPLSWTKEKLELGNQTVSAQDHAPVFICTNPLSTNRYVVINSGHTFHEKEFAAFNYLLFPRLGDWAVMKSLPGSADWTPLNSQFPEKVIRAGYFDEAWSKAKTIEP